MPAAGPAPSPAPWRFDAIGTAWEVVTAEPIAPGTRDAVAAAIDKFDRTWSRFRDDSVVSALGRKGGDAPLPPDAAAMLELYAELAAATEGAVNPLVGASLESLGYDRSYSFAAGEPVPAPPAWTDVLAWDGGRLLLRDPATIDVGALGKGRLVDIVSGILTRAGHAQHVVDGGGDLRVVGTAQRIGLQHPFDHRRAIGVWEVTDAALCASAIDRRAWGDGLHHVLDARTGLPVRTVAATWAVAPDAMHADAVATALFFDGGARLAFDRGVEWVRMTTDGRVEWSPGCRADLFTGAATVEP